MLGELLGESSGKITGIRVLPPVDGQPTKVECSLQGSGQLLGSPMTDMITYWQIARPDGTLYGEGQVLMMTQDGDSTLWSGFGVGRPTGPPPAGHYAVAGAFKNASEKLARLMTVATVTEYDVDANGNYRWKLWEWK